jgi:hypothetical protein
MAAFSIQGSLKVQLLAIIPALPGTKKPEHLSDAPVGFGCPL